MKKLALGILAHVDSGKTTLSEAMLYTAGEIRRLGRVDHKDTFLDTNEIEKERGITIFSKQAIMNCKNSRFTLLDTPGHVDFSAETERTLQVIDYAILVISGTDGVQNHTETLWQLLIRYNVPVFIFVNKTDISQKSRNELMLELKNRLNDGCIDFSEKNDNFFEELAMCDELLMDSFLSDGKINDSDIKTAIKSRHIFPCYFGSALKSEGVSEFLEGLDYYTKDNIQSDVFGAKIFKIASDEQNNRLTYMKITGGTLKVRDQLTGTKNGRDKWSEKVNQIRIYSGAKFTVVDEAVQGDICAVTGLTQTFAGEGLGTEQNSPSAVLEPVLSYRIILPDGTDIPKTISKLRQLADEDPQLNILWNEQLHEIHVKIMGEVQLEVLHRLILDRFNMDVSFDKGSIAYKETISVPVEGIGHYEPLKHYAEVHLLLEPAEPGSGLNFYTSCSEDILDRNWQRLIITHLEEKTHVGVLTGSPITDMNITLISGRAHQKHTEGGDFRQATYRAVRHGLRCAESVLLEPWYDFKLEIPQSCVGRALSDIQQMSGTFTPPIINGDTATITGTAPVSEMSGYHSSVTGYSSGNGRLICLVKGYAPCHNTEQVLSDISYNCDADTDNTADSVFCAHGAGFTVPWNEVKAYAHIDTGIDFDTDNEENEDDDVKIKSYISRAADDSELMKIFEQVYGPVKQDVYTAMKTQKRPVKVDADKHRKSIPSIKGPEYLLVDGYNIIFAWDDMKEIAKDSLEAARKALIDKLSNYQGVKQCELILVFDAYKVKGNQGEIERINNISIVYTKEAETADMYIEKTVHELGRKRHVRVATSDALEQLIILGNGAVRISASEFKKEIEDIEQGIRDFINQSNTKQGH